ncbi:hypothetical protein L3081_24415 [Colwellia sp. MSW7]|uniref:DUF1173 family protein n=1 Tax=Colwellia maritima TaxID=2912588 RepID=A0ABS9X6Y7_9GAMM|nr:hypothetical protein [Colwellia maritima]MCI2285974.1 hypothetical protein [Colwellia maritima]
MKLTKINRSSSEELALEGADVLGGDYQANLAALYQRFNVKCHCSHEQAVTMHIRKMQSSGLFFLADNPTSPLHHNNCEFYSARKNIELTPGVEQKIRPFELTTQFSDKLVMGGQTRKINSSNKKMHPRNVMSGLEGLFVTLISNAFCDYSFGGFVSIKDVITRIKNNKSNAKIKTGEADLVSNIYFGQKGIDYAKTKVKHACTKPNDTNEQPISLWFGLVTDVGDDYIMFSNKRLSCLGMYQPHKASGPYLAMGTIIKDCKTDFKQILLIPVVSKSIVLPVYSELQREKVLALQKWVYGRNRSGKYRFYIQKPLKPIVDEGKIVLADLLVVSKNKATGDKIVLALAGRNTARISLVYDSETIKLKHVNVEVVSQYFSRLLTEKRKNSALMRE